MPWTGAVCGLASGPFHPAGAGRFIRVTVSAHLGLFVHSQVDGGLGSFQLLAVMNRTAVNILVQVFILFFILGIMVLYFF